jgi:spectinomycin phosphotransferase
MLDKPDIPNEHIITCLHHAYGLQGVCIAFLPLGVDRNATAYRVGASDGRQYFAKLRRGVFDEITVAVPKALSAQGIPHILAPLVTRTGRLWASLDPFTLVLYPFVDGRDGYEVGLSDEAWCALGRTLKRIHSAELPPALVRRIRHETYSAEWRDSVRALIAGGAAGNVAKAAPDDRVAARLALLLTGKRREILDLVGRAERLAASLRERSLADTLCHADLHAGNLLITPGDTFYVVDWDDTVLAPKERDLMFAGGGLMGGWRTPEEEEVLFSRGYGETELDAEALAYFRYERIVQDIAVFCQTILLGRGGDREQSLRFLESNFLPNSVLEIACRSDRTAHRRPTLPGSK